MPDWLPILLIVGFPEIVQETSIPRIMGRNRNCRIWNSMIICLLCFERMQSLEIDLGDVKEVGRFKRTQRTDLLNFLHELKCPQTFKKVQSLRSSMLNICLIYGRR